ncbi:MAG: hypothetical protein JW822_00390 [Spirochaetales bacterium]|nr:hypothetical protein [Spirochaetales bacterium]
MKPKRFIFLWIAVWECIKILLLMSAASAVFEKTLILERNGIYWLVLLCGGQLLIPAIALVLFFKKTQFTPLLPFLRIGKIITLFTCFIILLLELTRETVFSLHFIFLPFTMSTPLFLFIIFSIDLIFLSVILSLKEEKRRN